jgi:hypothetical protein
MEVIDYSADLAAEWDAFVSQHPLASYGHLPAQFALAAAYEGVRNVSIVAREGRRLAGVLPLFFNCGRVMRAISIRQLSSGLFFPAGPLVSPQFTGKAEARVLDGLLDAIRLRARTLNADRVVITHPHVADGRTSIERLAYSPLLHYGFKPLHGVGLLLNLSQSGEQLAAGRRSGCRQAIAKAQSLGAQAGVIERRDEWIACHELNLQTLGSLAYSERQMAVIWDEFIARGHAVAHAVRFDGTIAAVAVAIRFHRAAYYWIGFGRRPQPVQGAAHLALWSAILAAQNDGYTNFELGSLDFENEKNIGISQFKQSFGGAPHQIISARLDTKPVKAAALHLAEAIVTSIRAGRARRRAEGAPAPQRSSETPPTPARGAAKQSDGRSPQAASAA